MLEASLHALSAVLATLRAGQRAWFWFSPDTAATPSSAHGQTVRSLWCLSGAALRPEVFVERLAALVPAPQKNQVHTPFR